jgi:hypothetical protein
MAVVSGFRRKADENCSVLGYDAASFGFLTLEDVTWVIPKRRLEVTTADCVIT